MENADVKQKVFDLMLEQTTLGIEPDQKFVDLIYAKFGKIATLQQVAAARAALKTIEDKADIEAFPRPEVLD